MKRLSLFLRPFLRPFLRSRFRTSWLLLLLPLATLGTAGKGCGGDNDIDFYAELQPRCDYRAAKTVIDVDHLEHPERTSLTPECKEDLEAYLPYDETWADAPAGLKDKVTEAFQVILAYPLQLPPENRILGQAPWSIPDKALCALAPQKYSACVANHEPRTDHPNIARNLFNYVMSHIERITYSSKGDGSNTASLTLDLVRQHGTGNVLTVTDLFWSGSNDFIMTPFRRASTITHEAFHADARSHSLCTFSGKGFNCDLDMSGSYGFETVYEIALVHGSGLLKDADGQYLLSNWDVLWLGYDVCTDLRFRVGTMRDLTEDTDDCNSVGVDWFLGHEGISRE